MLIQTANCILKTSGAWTVAWTMLSRTSALSCSWMANVNSVLIGGTVPLAIAAEVGSGGS